jgi:hypothetical protein
MFCNGRRLRLLYSHARANTALDRWAEVSLLLRKPILQEEDMLYTVAAAEAGLIYTDEVSHPVFPSFVVVRCSSSCFRIGAVGTGACMRFGALICSPLHPSYLWQMNAIAKNLNVLRGALSRWILPYDNNTRIESQCSTPHSVVENMPEEFRGKLTERQVRQLRGWSHSKRVSHCSHIFSVSTYLMVHAISTLINCVYHEPIVSSQSSCTVVNY